MEHGSALLIGIIVVLFAGFTQGLTSFGFALIALPFLARLMPMEQSVPIVVLLSLGTNFIVIAKCYRFVDVKTIWILIVSSLLAAPLGTSMLLLIDSNRLKLLAGLVIAGFSLLLIFGKSFAVKSQRLALIPVGLLSGFLNGSISLSGPPVALFLSSQNAEKNRFRANITLYAIVLNLATLASFGVNGLLTAPVIAYCAWLLPTMLIGVVAGISTVGRIGQDSFKRLVLFLILFSGLWTLLSAQQIV